MIKSIDTSNTRELRCPKCHRLLMREFIVKGRLEIRCWGRDCKELCRFEFRDYRDAKIRTGEQSPTLTKSKE